MINEDASRIFIDAHGNKGFSWGPVVFVPTVRPANELQVAGVVACAPTPLLEPVVDKAGIPVLGVGDEPVAYFAENQGFVEAFDIRHATNFIDANPVGLQLISKEEH